MVEVQHILNWHRQEKTLGSEMEKISYISGAPTIHDTKGQFRQNYSNPIGHFMILLLDIKSESKI